PTVLADNLGETFDLVLLSSKAYDLAGAIASFAPAAGDNTAIIPLLNGMRHIEILKSRIGPATLGGRCLISSALNEQREIVHFNVIHNIVYGELDGSSSERVRQIDRVFEGVGFEAHNSTKILLHMWEKWVFIAALAGATCLMRASVGDICAADG